MDTIATSEVKLTRLVAIVHDGDCTDCSYTPLEIPVNLDMQQAMKDYAKWWTEQTRPTDYVSLAEFLVRYRGAGYPEIEEFDY